MPLRVISTPYFLIPYLQPYNNDGFSNFWDGCKTCGSQRRTAKFRVLCRSSKYEQLHIRTFCEKNTDVTTGRKLKFMSSFMETALVQWKILDIHTSFLYHCFDEDLKHDDGAKFLCYVGTNAERLCVELCNFRQYNMLVNYLTFAINELNKLNW
jgi:hypothetical protein